MRIRGKLCSTEAEVLITLEDGRIVSIEPFVAIPINRAPDYFGDADVWIAPGFIDLQLNGYGGYDFNLGSWTPAHRHDEAPWRIMELAARAGTTKVCPTIVTGSREAIAASLRSLTSAMRQDDDLLRSFPGIHLEGPYLSSEEGPRGAHPLEHLRDPDWAEFAAWQEAAEGRIKIVTLAPERPGALPFIARLVNSGVVVSIGHTAANADQIHDAVLAGASLSTHLGNGAHAIMRRHPNYIWDQLADDGLTATIIADGHHLPAAVVKSMARGKGPDRLVLVSDSVSLGGCPPGLYDNDRHEVLASGKVVLAGTPYLAGAGHLLDVCVANALQMTGWSMGTVIRLATENPARVLGMDPLQTQIVPGSETDLTLFRLGAPGRPLEIVATIRDGAARETAISP